MALHLYDQNLEGIFNLNDVEFNELILTQEAISNIIEHAKEAHPNEFAALLKGQVDNKTLKIHDVDFRMRRMGERKLDLPFMTNVMGSVHSHPSSAGNPSEKDLEVFNKRGGLHIIASYPFNHVNIKAYNCDGQEIKFKVRRK